MNLPQIGETVQLRLATPAPPDEGMETRAQTQERLAGGEEERAPQVIEVLVVGHGRGAGALNLRLPDGSARIGVREAEGDGPGWVA